MKNYRALLESRAGFSLKLHRLLLIMRLSLALLIIFSNFAVAGIGQDITIRSNKASLVEILEQIESQSDYTFLYRSNLFSDTKLDRIQISGNLEKVLQQVLVENGFGYRISDRVVVIHKLPAPPEFPQQPVYARGKVTDANGQPLVGVNVILEGTTRGTITDEQGEFELTLEEPEGVLLFSYVGFLSKKVNYTGEYLEVTLEEDIASLNEVMVIGYGTIAKKNLSTAISKVDPDDIPSSANNSIPELLMGRAAGLQTNINSSQPGGDISISIRGKGTPLLVVDGIIYPNRPLEPDNGSVELQGVNRGVLAGLNPSDIESIEILKDASASIYGVSAGNGVMIITTKKGKTGKMNVTYEGNRSLIQNLPYLQPLNATDYMTYFNQLSLDKYLSDKEMAPFGANPANTSGYAIPFSDEEIANAGTGTDWLGKVLRNGNIDKHALTISGGSEKVRYFFSSSYYNQTGTVKASDMRRFTGRMNLNIDLNKFLTLNTVLSLSRNNYSNPQAGWQSGGSGSQGLNALQAAIAYPSYVPVYDENEEYSLFSLTGNPVSLLDIMDKTRFQSLFANLSLDIDIIPGTLTGRLSYGNNNEYAVRDFFVPSNVFWFQLYQSRVSISEDRRQNQTMEATLSFNKTIGSFVKIDAVTGVGRYPEDWSGLSAETSDVPDAINIEGIGQATGPKTINSYYGGAEFRSFFIRSNFDILDRYIVSAVLRRDGADRFFPDNKYQNFPSISMAWKMSNENVLANAEFIDLLKPRISYGLTGERPGELAYGIFSPGLTGISFNNGANMYIPYYLTQLNNPDFQWPINKTLDIGLDFEFFKRKVSGSFDVFREDRTRMNIRATTDQLSFLPTVPENGGHQRRTGVEAALSAYPVSNGNFTWSVTANFTHFTNEWIERFPNDPLPHGAAPEDPLGTLYVYETDGILGADEPLPPHQPVGAQKPGSPLFVDQDGDGLLTDDDIIKYPGVPKAIVGLGNNFQYKNFDLGIFMYGQLGAWGYDYTSLWGDPQGFLASNQSGTERIKEAWSTSNPDGLHPGASYIEWNVEGLNAGIDTRLAKRDFVRCRNISLGYTFNSTSLSKYVNQLRVYLDVQNAFIITNFPGVDPEIQAASIKVGPAPYPMTRTFSLGAKANF